MIERPYFFNVVKRELFDKKLKQSQVDGMNAILDEWDIWCGYGFQMPSKLAYMLATTYHETAGTMQPIAEFGKGVGKKYGEIDPETKQTYYGRGFVQLTWRNNYEKVSKELNIDAVRNPNLVMDLPIATKILFNGMHKGWFTGRKLGDYFHEMQINYLHARKIINGMDKATEIAQYALSFREAIADA